MLVEERAEDAAPVLAREPPRRRPQDVVLAAGRIGEEAPLPERVGEAKHAASVDADEIGELLERHRSGRLGDGLEDGEAAVETLNRRRVEGAFGAHGAEYAVGCRGPKDTIAARWSSARASREEGDGMLFSRW